MRFWLALDELVATSSITIDRPRGSAHPRYPDTVYPLDYGYLKDTTSADNDGIDIWLGSLAIRSVSAVVICLDLLKRDCELKILLGCTQSEQELILAFHNRGQQSAQLLHRPSSI